MRSHSRHTLCRCHQTPGRGRGPMRRSALLCADEFASFCAARCVSSTGTSGLEAAMRIDERDGFSIVHRRGQSPRQDCAEWVETLVRRTRSENSSRRRATHGRKSWPRHARCRKSQAPTGGGSGCYQFRLTRRSACGVEAARCCTPESARRHRRQTVASRAANGFATGSGTTTPVTPKAPPSDRRSACCCRQSSASTFTESGRDTIDVRRR